MLGSPVLDRYGHIYAGVSQFPRGYEPRGLLVCLDGNSHKIRWEYRAAGAVESTPVIGDDDVIYFGDNAGEIHAVDLLGNGLWTAQVGSPVRWPARFSAPAAWPSAWTTRRWWSCDVPPAVWPPTAGRSRPQPGAERDEVGSVAEGREICRVGRGAPCAAWSRAPPSVFRGSRGGSLRSTHPTDLCCLSLRESRNFRGAKGDTY